MIGQSVSLYQITDRLGQGGMGIESGLGRVDHAKN